MRVSVLLLVALAPSLAVPARLHAQARELGSPVPDAAPVTGSEGDGREPPPEARPPASYEHVEVPPAPRDSGIRYPDADLRRDRTTTSAGGLRIPSGVATRLRALDSDLQVLSLRGSNVVGGVVSILAGGVAIAVGVVQDLQMGVFGYGVSPYLYVYGGSGLVRGVIELALMTNASGAAITFAHMPMTTMQEVQARLEYGERELAQFAERAMIGRILDGAISVAAGLAIVPIYLGPNGFAALEDNPLVWIGLATASISVISGIVTLVSSTEAERRWSAYRELRDRLGARGREARRRAREVGAPGLDGAGDAPQVDGVAIRPYAAAGPASGWLGVTASF